MLDADGDHFSAGLDLSELTERDAFGGSGAFPDVAPGVRPDRDGTLPVISVLKGAVVGGGLELASATHIRVAETSTFYALPEGQHGLFVGGGGSVRIPRLIGAHRMTDMMLTGRVLRPPRRGTPSGLSHYLAGAGEGLGRRWSWPARSPANSPVTNFAVLQALPRIAQASPREGYLMESLMAAVAQGSDEAKHRMRAFLDGRAGKVTVMTRRHR